MSKKSLFALLLAAVMMLSGCSLVVRDSAVDVLQSIIVVNGEHVNKQDFINAYDYNLYMEEYYQQMMASFGFSQDVSVDRNAVLEDTVNSYISSLVSSQKADELGFDEFTDAEKAEIDAQAEEEFAAQLTQIKDYYFADSTLEGEALDAQVKAYAESMGYTIDTFRASVQSAKISERLESSVTDSVTIGDAELQAALDAKIADEKADYEGNVALYATRANIGTQTFYTPAGFRSVRVIEIAAPTVEGDSSETVSGAAANAALVETEALVARLTAGEAFETLTEGVKALIVCETSTDVDAAIAAAAMALTEKGAVSEPIATADGYALVQYVDDIAEHTATLDEARDLIYEETLENAKTAAYQAAVNAWVENSKIDIYLDRLN